ncbi:MAG: SDR family NAD(P)-dependent oxidoreductase, partial [Ignavibacteriaceae bacterium]
MSDNENNKFWVVILGASSGFGEAAAKKLSEDGYNIIGVHLDRQATMKNVEKVIDHIKSQKVQAKFYNVNAADEGKRAEIIKEIKSLSKGEQTVKVLMHSLAFGTLKPFVPQEGEQALTKVQMEMTL